MDFTSVKGFLDFHSENFKEIRGAIEYNSQISLCRTYSVDGVQVFKGINILADMMGLDITEIKKNDEDFPYKYEFVYNGVNFFQIEKKPIN